MRISLKSIFGLTFILLFNHLAASSQFVKGGEFSPEALLAESKALEGKAKLALSNAALYQKEGSLFLDSARFISSVLRNKSNSENISFFVNQLESHYMFAYRYIAMADSMTILAENYREESINKTKEAYAMMGKDVEISFSRSDDAIQAIDIPKNLSTLSSSNKLSLPEPKKAFNNSSNLVSSSVSSTSKNDILSQQELIYIVQLGAGNMDMNYFKKVPDIKAVSCKDGIKRYVLPVSFSKSDANKKKAELMKQGYEQVFIRTKESLDKISN